MTLRAKHIRPYVDFGAGDLLCPADNLLNERFANTLATVAFTYYQTTNLHKGISLYAEGIKPMHPANNTMVLQGNKHTMIILL